jgi:hypothetical protein
MAVPTHGNNVVLAGVFTWLSPEMMTEDAKFALGF